MRPYYADPCCHPHRHRYGRPGIEIDFVTGWGGGYYQTPIARPQVVVVTPAATYMPGQMMPQPYAATAGTVVTTTGGGAGYYQQQQYQYQYQQQYANPPPPYPQW